MSTIHKIAKNVVFLVISQSLNFLLSFVYMIYMARYLGPVGFGVITFALAFTSIFSVFSDFGLQLLVAREVARDESQTAKYLINIVAMKIVMVVITFTLIAITINLMGYPWQTIQIVYLLGVSVIITAFTQIFYSVFQAYQRLEFQAIGQLLNAVLMFALVMIAVRLKWDIVNFAFLYVITGLIVLIYSLVIWRCTIFRSSRNWNTRKIEVDWAFWKPVIKMALPFGLAVLFVTTFYWISTVLLSVMKGNDAVGWYNAAYRMVLVLSFIPAAVIAAIYPVMSKLYITSQESIKSIYDKSLKYLMVLCIPIGVGTTVLAHEFILVIFGAEYANSVIALQILVWSEVCIFISMPMANVFNSLNKQTVITKITIVCLILNIGLNLILIQLFGIIGASITTVLTEAISLMLTYIFIAKIGYGLSWKYAADLLRVAASSVLMGVFLICFRSLQLTILLPSAILLYFILLCLIKGIDKEDMALIKKIVLNGSK